MHFRLLIPISIHLFSLILCLYLRLCVYICVHHWFCIKYVSMCSVGICACGYIDVIWLRCHHPLCLTVRFVTIDYALASPSLWNMDFCLFFGYAGRINAQRPNEHTLLSSFSLSVRIETCQTNFMQNLNSSPTPLLIVLILYSVVFFSPSNCFAIPTALSA